MQAGLSPGQVSKRVTRVRIKKEVAAPVFQKNLSPSSSPPSLFLSPGLSCSGTARGADGPSVIQRGMFHVHLAQAQIPPAGKLFSGQPPVIRGLESTAQHNIAPLSLLCFFSFLLHPLSISSWFITTTTDIHIYLFMSLFTLFIYLYSPVL